MPTARKLIAGLALALTAVSCSQDQQSPTAPTSTQAPTAAAKPDASLLTNVAAGGPLFTGTIGGVLTPTGQNINGTLTVTHMAVSPAGQLLVSGTFTYVNAGQTVVQAFTDVPSTLTKLGAPTQPTCSILVLDIGAIHLDLLGLVVDLAPVHLDIHAVSGSGNLLGNLLCAVANLLNGPNLSGLIGAITNLLNQINAILAGL